MEREHPAPPPWRVRRRQLRALCREAFLALARWPMYFLGGLLPKNPKLWAVGSWSGDRFADNSKWLFLYLTAPCRQPDADIIWISRRSSVVREIRALGRPAAFLWSPRGIWSVLRAGVHIVDADTRGIAFWASKSAKVVNLFHGIALKRIGADITTSGHHLAAAFHGPTWRRRVLRFLAPWFSEKYDLVVASSETNAAVMASAFQVSGSTVAITGLPRNDVLQMSDAEIMESFGLPSAARPAPAERLILYAPTFRDFDRSGRALPLDWERLEDLMSRHDARFLLKLHPNDAARVPALSRFQRIQTLEAETDIYPLLRHIDVLITDYSSIFFDFLLCDRPLVFYPYDIERYRARDREFYYPYEEVTPGDHVHDFQELLQRLDQILGGRWDPYVEARLRVRERFHPPEGRLSCESLTGRVSELSS